MTRDPLLLTGKVEEVLVGATFGSIVTTIVKKIQLIRSFGIKGDNHSGTRLADVRERELLKFGLPKGVEVANHREYSAVSVEDLMHISKFMHLPDPMPRGCLGENIILSGIPKLTQLPTGTMLFFRKDEATIRAAVLVVWGENTPCELPGEVIQKHFPDIPRLATLFPKCAIGRRGIVGSIYCSGYIHKGDTIIVRVPRQQIYEPYF